jgi:hypothetical protein
MEQYTKTIAACDIHSVKHFTLAMQDKGAGNDKWLHEPSDGSIARLTIAQLCHGKPRPGKSAICQVGRST